MLKPIFLHKKYWKILLLPFLLFHLKFYSQENDSLNVRSSNTIFLKGEASIYSSDDNFNHQISEKTILIKGNSVKCIKNSGKVLIIVNSYNYISTSRDSKDNTKSLFKKINPDDVKAKKIINEYQSGLKYHIIRKFENHQSEQRFSNLKKTTLYYLLPEVNLNKKLKKACSSSLPFFAYVLCFLLFLPLLYWYDKRSISYYYSIVYNVRPPPFYCLFIKL